MNVPETSVVIRTFNEEQHLAPLLCGIAEQTYRDFEIVVVDSGSYDGTCEVAQRHGARLVRIESRDFTFGYSLNVGVRTSRGRFVAVVSAHTLPLNSGWLQNLVEPLRDPRVATVYGRQLGIPGSKFSEVQDFRRTFGTQRIVLSPPQFFANNANSAICRALWEQHPFDEVLPGLEDIEWAKYWMERDYKVIYEPRAAIYHIHQETWRQVRRRYYREALAAKWIGIKRRIHIPREVAREAGRLAGDLLHASRQHSLRSHLPSILQFRFYKSWGTVQGIWDGATVRDPRARQAMFFDNRYKAVVIRGPGRAALEELEIPEVKPGDVLVKVAYVGVCATDIEILNGELGYYKSGKASYPITPGHEFSGVVVKVGSNIGSPAEGTPVVVECIQTCRRCEACHADNWIGCADRKEVGVMGRNGAYAQYLVVPGEFVHSLPESADLKQAALCEPMAVVLKGLRRLERALGPNRARRFAVVGAGPIGHLCARILSLRGHHVGVYDRDPARLALFHGSPVHTFHEFAGLREFDAIIEATGSPEALHHILEESPPGSTLLLLGLPYARQPFNFETLVGFDKTVVGSVGSTAADFREAVRLLPQLDLTPFLQKVIPLDQFRAAWDLSRTHSFLKVLIAVDPQLGDSMRAAVHTPAELAAKAGPGR